MAAAIALFPIKSGDVTQPSGFYAAVTPSDSVDLTNVARSLFIGGAGNVTVVAPPAPLGDGATTTFNGVVAGSILPVMVARVKVGAGATLTTCTNMVALS